MKSLIRKMSFAICTLLLTCTFCLAQIEFRTGEPSTAILTVSGDSTKLCVGGAEVITAKLLIAYETECYNDTSYTDEYIIAITDTVRYGKQPNGDVIKPYNGYHNGICTIKYFTHKEPTFKDFLAWARKKYGL